MKQLSEFLQEALSPKHIEQVRQWIDGKPLAGQKISEHVFGGKETLIHPFNDDQVDVPIHPEVKSHLEKFGYKIPSSAEYHAGYAVDKHERMVSIGKALRRTKADPSVISSFENDPNRAASNKKKLAVAYTWEPHHVAGMSTGRGWTSCMNMDTGINKHYLEHDITHGTHVAYLIHDDDHKIESPLARIALKPFKSEDGEHIILRPENRTYGTAKDSFGQHVSKWAETHFPAKIDTVYEKPHDLYNDTYSRYVKFHPETIKKNVDAAIDQEHSDYHALKQLQQITNPDDLHIAMTHTLTHYDPLHANNQAHRINDLIDAPLHIHTANAMVNHLIHNKIYDVDAIENNNYIMHRVDGPTVNKFAEHILKIHNMSPPSPKMITHPELSDENLHKLVAKSDHALSYVEPHRATKDMVNRVHEIVKSQDFDSQNYHGYDGIVASKHFDVSDMQKAIEHNIGYVMTDDHKSNISLLTKRLHPNPNYTIDVARNLDKKYSALTGHHFAIGHVDATSEDADQAFARHQANIPLEKTHLRAMKSGKAFDRLFEHSPEMMYKNVSAWNVLPSNKNAHFISAAQHEFISDEADKKILDEVTPKNLPVKNPDSPEAIKARRLTGDYIHTLVYRSASNPEMHKHIHNAIENAVNSDTLFAHRLIHSAASNKDMVFDKDVIDRANEKIKADGYNPINTTNLKYNNG